LTQQITRPQMKQKKVATNTDENNHSTKTQEVPQNLENDTFVKSTEEYTANSTYKPEKKKLTTVEVTALKEDQENLKADKKGYSVISVTNSTLSFRC